MSDPITRLNAALEGRYCVERELGGPRRLVSAVVLTVFLVSSVAGCYNTTAVIPPSPRAPVQMEIDRVVLNSGEIVQLDPGQYELREEELLVRSLPLTADDVRVIPRSDIARFETRQLNTGRTVAAVILVPVAAFTVFITFAVLTIEG